MGMGMKMRLNLHRGQVQLRDEAQGDRKPRAAKQVSVVWLLKPHVITPTP